MNRTKVQPTTGEIIRHGGKSWLRYQEGSGSTVEILDIHVDEGNRRKGVGSGMIMELRARLRKDNLLIFAVTRVTNTAAQEFYEKLGFRIVGRLHQFYRTREEIVNGGNGYTHALMYGLDI